MELTVVDTDTEFANVLYQKFENIFPSSKILKNGTGNEGEIDLRSTNCSDIAKAIIDTDHKDEGYVVFININGDFGGAKRQNEKGIEILKWLRLNGCNNHCIMYSFQKVERIVKTNPFNAILLSKGVTFVQLPQSFEGFLSSEVAERSNLLPFFRAEIDLVKIRHELANIYGLQKIMENHDHICPDFKHNITTLKDNYFYKLIEYLQKHPIDQDSFIPPRDQVSSLKKLIKNISGYRARVIYLDDKANLGWFDFLKSIIGNKFDQIIFKDTDDENSLFNKFENLQDRNPVDLFICDLRLKLKEEGILDFRNLLSYKLIKKIRERNPKQMIMYFSATNDLNKYKSMLGGKGGNPDLMKPQYIFTKEGIDQNYSKSQSFHNYKELISFLDTVLKKGPSLKKVQNLYLYDQYKANQIQTICDEIEKIKESPKILNSPYNCFDLIIFDTNAFYDPQRSIEILWHIHNNPGKTCLSLSVFAEMRGFVSNNQNNSTKEVQHLLASKISEYFTQSDFNLSEECMDNYQVQAAREFRFRKDFADSILIKLAKAKSQSLKTLFVSNDRAYGMRKRGDENEGPIVILDRWIKEEKNSNLFLSDVKGFLGYKCPPEKIHNGGNSLDLNSAQKHKSPPSPMETSINSNSKQLFQDVIKENSPKLNKAIIKKIELNSSGRSYNVYIDNAQWPVVIPLISLGDTGLQDLKEKLLNTEIMYSDNVDLKRQIILLVKN